MEIKNLFKGKKPETDGFQTTKTKKEDKFFQHIEEEDITASFMNMDRHEDAREEPGPDGTAVLQESVTVQEKVRNQKRKINEKWEELGQKILPFLTKYKKSVIAGGLAFAVILSSGSYLAFGGTSVNVHTPSGIQTVKVFGKATTMKVLSKANIQLGPYDSTSAELNTVLADDDNITVTKAKEILVSDASKVVSVKTALQEDGDILKQAGIKAGKNATLKKVDMPSGKAIYCKLEANEKLVSVDQPVEFQTQYKENQNQPTDYRKTLKEGKDGLNTIVQKVTYGKDGKIAKRTTIYSQAVRKPVPKVVEVGKKNVVETSGGSNAEYRYEKTVVATGYCPCAQCCGVSTGRTASGTMAAQGRTIAASSQYAFGTKMYIPYFGGTYTVEDRGGAINGDRIDVFFNSHSQALQFGRRTIKVYVLK